MKIVSTKTTKAQNTVQETSINVNERKIIIAEECNKAKKNKLTAFR